MQFGKFSKGFVVGDKFGWPGLGYTYAGQTSVKALIVARAPRTLLLIAGAAILWLSSASPSASSLRSSGERSSTEQR